jgi:CheY-like chemotaxis protein
VEGDVTQIRQIVMNLITNAGDSIGNNKGTITISTYSLDFDEAAKKEMSLSDSIPPGQYACIQVKDDGSGMDEVTQQKIFDPFFTTKQSGRGLGLSAVLGIVKGHGGSISIASEPGIGTSIKILLPVSSTSPLSPGIQTQADNWSGEGKVLFADDEPEIRELAKAFLSKFGFQVIEACDGLEAIELFHQHKAELRIAILDVMMPGKTGLEVYDVISATSPEMPVIISTGYNENETIQRVANQEKTAFLKKPYAAKTLQDLVSKMLNKAASSK